MTTFNNYSEQATDAIASMQQEYLITVEALEETIDNLQDQCTNLVEENKKFRHQITELEARLAATTNNIVTSVDMDGEFRVSAYNSRPPRSCRKTNPPISPTLDSASEKFSHTMAQAMNNYFQAMAKQ